MSRVESYQVDLQTVEAVRRASLWRDSARQLFPGLSVRDIRETPPAGSIRGTALGPGRLWSVNSPPLVMDYAPGGLPDSPFFSVMLQISGSTLARQHGRRCVLTPGTFCLMDDLLPFRIEVTGASQVLIVQLPRAAVVGRHPGFEHWTAEVFCPDGATPLLRGLLLSMLEAAPGLDAQQGTAALGAVVRLLGATRPLNRTEMTEMHWRARQALDHIDLQFADPGLGATGVARAQGISRRRLDEIMLLATGSSLTAQIWSRRLLQSAADLCDPQRERHTVAAIGFAAGFGDAAHFTRSFKRRFGCTPREWRARGAHASSGPVFGDV